MPTEYIHFTKEQKQIAFSASEVYNKTLEDNG